MKLTAPRADLADAVAWVAQAIPKDPQQVALAGMKLSAADDTLTLQAFDWERGHTARVHVEGLDDGEVLVSGRFLNSVVGSLKGATVDLVLDDGTLTISTKASTYRAQAMDVSDFPALPPVPESRGVVDGDQLADLVNRCRGPVDDGSPFDQVRGLHLEGSADDPLTGVGMSRFAGVEVVLPWQGQEPLDATLPSKTIAAAVKGLRGPVTIGQTDGVLGLSDAERTVTLRTFDAQFVDWRLALRAASADVFAVTLDRDELADAVKRAGSLSDDEVPIALTFASGAVEIAIEAGERGMGDEVLDAHLDNPDAGVGQVVRYSARLLGDVLSVMPPGQIRVGIGKGPAVIRPVESDLAVTSFAMPRRVK
jgi:DNA polymerase-3 subunit beta